MGYFDSTDGYSVNDTVVVDGGRNISAVGATFTGTVVGGTFSGNISAPNVVNSFNGSTGTVTYSPRLATSSLTGVASFGNEFVVSAAGAVSLTSNYVKTINGATGAITITQGSNVTVTTVGNTITIASNGGGSSPPLASATVTGVASFGNEFVVSAAGAVSLTSNYVKTFNGSTGTVTYSPPLATTSVTGVASFNSSDFTVSSGAVSLTSVARTNSANTFTTIQNFSAGFTAPGATFTTQLNTVGFKVNTVGGDEGGQIDFGLAATNTTLTGTVAIDVFQNKLRFYETGNSTRGAYIDLSAAGAGVATNLVYTPPVATSSVTGVASFDSTDFTVSATGSVVIADTALNSGGLITQKNASGTSTSGTAGTVVATLTAAANRMFIAWQVVAAQVSGANTTLTVTITYSDATTAAITTTASTASTVFGNVGGLHRTTGGAAPTSNNIVTIDATKKVTKIEVTTAGTGTSLRAATIGALEVGQ